MLPSSYINSVDETLEKLSGKVYKEGEYVLRNNDWADHELYVNEHLLEPIMPDDELIVRSVDEVVKRIQVLWREDT